MPDEVECVGGPADGVVYSTTASNLKIPAAMTPDESRRISAWSSARNLAWLGLGPEPEDDSPTIRCHVYADSGRRTAEGRRVFVPAV